MGCFWARIPPNICQPTLSQKSSHYPRANTSPLLRHRGQKFAVSKQRLTTRPYGITSDPHSPSQDNTEQLCCPKRTISLARQCWQSECVLHCYHDLLPHPPRLSAQVIAAVASLPCSTNHDKVLLASKGRPNSIHAGSCRGRWTTERAITEAEARACCYLDPQDIRP